MLPTMFLKCQPFLLCDFGLLRKHRTPILYGHPFEGCPFLFSAVIPMPNHGMAAVRNHHTQLSAQTTPSFFLTSTLWSLGQTPSLSSANPVLQIDSFPNSLL